MNENHIQQVVEIERQAQDIHEKAIREAQQLPVLADQEAQAIIEKTRAQAHEQARLLVEKARADDEVAAILAQAEEKNGQTEALAMSNFDRAVAHVLDRVIGSE